MISLFKEEFTALEALIKVAERDPVRAQPEFLSSIRREMERGRVLAARTERITALIGRGALAALAGLVLALRILGYGNDTLAVIIAALVGSFVTAGLIYAEASQGRIRRIIREIGEEIGRRKGEELLSR